MNSVSVATAARPESTSTQHVPLTRLAVQALIATVVLSFTILPHKIGRLYPGFWKFGVSIAGTDLFVWLLVPALVAVAARHARARSLTPLELFGFAFVVVATVSFALHPTTRAALYVSRYAIAVLLCVSLARDLVLRQIATVALGAGALVQAVVATAEHYSGHNVGLQWLGEADIPFRAGTHVAAGTMRDPYPLAGLALMAAALCAMGWSQKWLPRTFALAVAAAGGLLAAISGSRGAGLTVLVVAAALTLTAGRRGRAAAAVLVVVFGSMVLVENDLWLGRLHNTTKIGTEDVTNGRADQVGQAKGLFKSAPILGVGPGNYSTALRDNKELTELGITYGATPAHNVVLEIAAEEGVIGLAVAALVALWTLRALLRQRFAWLTPVAALVPYLLVDLVFWFFPEGLFQIAIALSFVIAADLARRNPGAEPGVPSAAIS